MFDPELYEAIEKKRVYIGTLNIDASNYPDWNQLVPYFDMSYNSGNKRARNPQKIFSNINENDFSFTQKVFAELRSNLKGKHFDCHCYAGFSPNAFASPVHEDPMGVLFIMIQGTVPWRIFENGEENRSTFSKRLIQGDYVHVPKGIPHAAYPDCSRVGFSFGLHEDG